MTYRLDSDVELSSGWLPASACTGDFTSVAAAIATAIEGVDPAETEVRVLDAKSGAVVWRSTGKDYE